MGWVKFLVGTDLHGDKQDPGTSRLFLDFCKEWKPKIKVFGGDLWDFRPLRNGADEEEKRQSMQEDYDAGMKFLLDFQPNYFLRGNHDERLWELAEKRKGVLSDYADRGIAEIGIATSKLKCKVLPYHKRDGVLRLGHLKIIHGFACGVYAARATALVYGSTLFGHIHAIDEHAIPGLERRVARAIGCLCLLDMPYNSRQPNTLRQAHGFAYGLINEKTGSYFVWQAEEVDGTWMLPTQTIECKTKHGTSRF